MLNLTLDIIKQAMNELDADIHKRQMARNALAELCPDITVPALRGSGRTMSAQARLNMKAGQRKRWAKFYKAKGNGKL